MSKGKCGFCNATLGKAAMTKHLKSCKQRKAVSDTSSAKRNLQKTKIFHLVVEGRDLPEYWMHLSAAADTTLENLDDFLRDIWLECVDIPDRNIMHTERQIMVKLLSKTIASGRSLTIRQLG